MAARTMSADTTRPRSLRRRGLQSLAAHVRRPRQVQERQRGRRDEQGRRLDLRNGETHRSKSQLDIDEKRRRVVLPICPSRRRANPGGGEPRVQAVLAGGVVMLIHEMTEDECRAALERVSFGRLACAHKDQPCVLPIYFSYDGKHLYRFGTLGQKIEWMRCNPLVCLEIDERSSIETNGSVERDRHGPILSGQEPRPSTPAASHASSSGLSGVKTGCEAASCRGPIAITRGASDRLR